MTTAFINGKTNKAMAPYSGRGLNGKQAIYHPFLHAILTIFHTIPLLGSLTAPQFLMLRPLT
jgi:hypothetical protein